MVIVYAMRHFNFIDEKKNMMMRVYTISKILNFNYPLPPLVTEKKYIIDAFSCDA